MKILNTGRLLRWRIIHEEYCPEKEYIQGNKNMVAYVLSRFPINDNQDYTRVQL